MLVNIRNILLCLLIGAICVIPGVNCANVLIITGTYSDFVNKSAGSNKNVYKHLNICLFLLFAFIGTYLFSEWSIGLFYNERYGDVLRFSLVGIIAGTIPRLVIMSGIEQDKLEISDFIHVFLGISIAIINIYLNNNLTSSCINLIPKNTQYNCFYSFLFGIQASLHIIIPGLWWEEKSNKGLEKNIFSNYKLDDTGQIIIFLFGLIIGVYFVLKVIKFIIDNYPRACYMIFTGLMAGTLIRLMAVSKIINPVIDCYIAFKAFTWRYTFAYTRKFFNF